MARLIDGDTDLEMTRYNEAAQIKQYSGLSPTTVRGGMMRYDPITKSDAVYVDLPSGGKLRIGDRPVQMAQADTLTTRTDATAAAPAALVPTATPAPVSLRPTEAPTARQPIAEYDAQLRAGSDKAPRAADFEAGGYTAEEFAKYQQSLQGPEMVPVKLTPDQIAEYAQQSGSEMVAQRTPGLGENIQALIYNALDPKREATGGVADVVRSAFSKLPGTENLDPGDLRFFSNLFTDVVDMTTPAGAAMSVDEGTTMMKQGWNLLSSGDSEKMASGAVDMTVGAALSALGVAEFVPYVKGLSEPVRGTLRQMSPQAKNLLADAIGASRAITQGDKDMLMEIFQPAGTPRSLGAAGVNDATMQSAPLAPIPLITPRDLEGARIIPTVADLMRTGGYYTGIDASKVDVPEPMMGGPGYPLLQSSQQAGLAWAIQGKSIGTKKAGSGADLIAVTAMNPTSHQSNISFINSLIKTTSAYVRDGRIQPEVLGELDARVRTSAAGSDPSLARLARFPGFNSPNLQEFINGASFQERSRIADIIGSKGMQEQGLPSVARVLQETVDPRYAGANPRDTLLFIEPDFSAPPVDLLASGLPVHPSYRYGIRGRVFGALDQNISTFEMFPDFWGEKNVNAFGPAFNTGGRRAFDMALPIQKVTGKQVDDLERILQTTSGSGPRLSPIDTRIVINSMLDKWKPTTKAITAGGASPQAFVDAITNSKYRPALTSYSADDIKAGAKSGDLVAYQLGDDDVFFAIDAKPDYSWAGVDMMPGDKALVGVVSNAPGAKGTAVPSVMAKAIENGVTVLDAFAVPSAKFPDGFLPSYYKKFGFEEAGRVPFDKEMYITDHGEQAYKDLLQAWRTDGWDESMGMPPVIVMRWSGSDADRTATAAGIRGAGAPSHRAAPEGFIPEAEGLAGRGGERSVSAESTSVERGITGGAGVGDGVRLAPGAGEAAKSVLGLTPEQLRNRGTPESQIQQLMQRRQ